MEISRSVAKHARAQTIGRNSAFFRVSRSSWQIPRQRSHVRAEGLRNLAEREERQIAFPPFDAAEKLISPPKDNQNSTHSRTSSGRRVLPY